MLPDLGEGFVKDCLKYYNLDPEKVVHAILEENLPECLAKLDRHSSESLQSSKMSQDPPKKKYSKEDEDNVHKNQSIPKLKKYNNDVEEKLIKMSPMNLFFNKVKSSPQTHKDKRSLFFTDLLHPSLGNLESSLQINFMVEYDWLMMNYEVTKNELDVS